MDMALAAQDVIVGLIAAGAAAVVVRRVLGFAATDTAPTCASCDTGGCTPAASSGSSGASATPIAAPGPVARPLVFIRSSDR